MDASDYIAISAVVIALASLYVAVKQSNLAREHNRLSVRPFLTIYRKQFLNQPIEYSLENRGIGPAIVNKFSVLVDDGEANSADGNKLLGAADLLGIRREDVGGHLLGPDEVLKPGQEIVFLRFKRSGEDEPFHNELIRKIPRLKFKIGYKSMYDEQYEYLGNG